VAQAKAWIFGLPHSQDRLNPSQKPQRQDASQAASVESQDALRPPVLKMFVTRKNSIGHPPSRLELFEPRAIWT
jgi:hypothetical protein